MSGKKTLAIMLGVGTAVVGAATVLAMEIYRRPVELALDLATWQLKLAGAREESREVGGLPMRYLRAGRSAEPVVLIHGLGGSAEAWLYLLPLLQRDFQVYAPDMPGFGRTPPAPGKQCIATHVEYLGHFLDALGYEKVILLGQSLGGWIATRYTAEHPERVRRLYLLNSAGLMREGIYVPYTPDRETARKYFRHITGYQGPLPSFLLDAFVQISQAPAYKDFIANYDPAEEVDDILPSISVPTTIIWGTGDRIFPLTCAYDFQKGIPNSRLVFAPGVSHNTQVGAAGMVARIMREDASSRLA